jgi:hypothetical protein
MENQQEYINKLENEIVKLNKIRISYHRNLNKITCELHQYIDFYDKNIDEKTDIVKNKIIDYKLK